MTKKGNISLCMGYIQRMCIQHACFVTQQRKPILLDLLKISCQKFNNLYLIEKKVALKVRFTFAKNFVLLCSSRIASKVLLIVMHNLLTKMKTSDLLKSDFLFCPFVFTHSITACS